jgi:hypothetical protein
MNSRKGRRGNRESTRWAGREEEDHSISHIYAWQQHKETHQILWVIYIYICISIYLSIIYVWGWDADVPLCTSC